MTATETVEHAWLRIYGTPFNHRNTRCTFFETGFNAGRFRA